MIKRIADITFTVTVTGFWIYAVAYWALTGKLV